MQAHAHPATEETPAARLIGLFLAAVAPLAAASWALANWWPVSGAVWLAALLVVWTVLFSSAPEDVAA